MNLRIGRRGTLAALGLICAAALWAANMQLGVVLPYPGCRDHLPLAGFGSLAASVASLAAALCSWRTWLALTRPARPASDARRSLRLLAGLGAGGGSLFLVALALQAVAGFILTGCER